MLLSFTSIDQHANFRECSWWLTTPEAAFDALSAVAAKGNQILSALLIDEDQRTILPVDAFDGDIFSAPLKELEQEWQQILSVPVNRQPARNEYWEKVEKK
ncbi:hypothetical protein [Spirosoma pollinicola]|uniref:Uncharacterized protein n=1 Tax=Spirosoma pollinicola TaxID=2057025 RepID=A0A2K8YWN2_9BACT|nr:hypothetical protein [Spirosoma pollinicola]AUD02009.1 hypothetical protein CWM47_09405 [Spirosoma pollinicola]